MRDGRRVREAVVAEVPCLSEVLLDPRDARGAMVIFRVRDIVDVGDTGLKVLINYLHGLSEGAIIF